MMKTRRYILSVVVATALLASLSVHGGSDTTQAEGWMRCGKNLPTSSVEADYSRWYTEHGLQSGEPRHWIVVLNEGWFLVDDVRVTRKCGSNTKSKTRGINLERTEHGRFLVKSGCNYDVKAWIVAGKSKGASTINSIGEDKLVIFSGTTQSPKAQVLKWSDYCWWK